MKDFSPSQIVIDADETAYSDVIDLGGEEGSFVFNFTVSAWVAGTLDLTVQVDTGTGDWDDYADLDDNFTDAPQFTGNGEVQVTLPTIYPRVRVKIVSASSADMALDIYGFTKGGAGSGGGVVSSVEVVPGAMQSQGTDATGQDTYATVKTPSADAKHVYISLEGSNAAIISFNGGTTDHITVQGGSVVLLDDVTITSGVAIQAKNRTGGSNYTNLNISIW